MDWKRDQIARLQANQELLDWWIHAYQGNTTTVIQTSGDTQVDKTTEAAETLKRIYADLTVYIERLREYG